MPRQLTREFADKVELPYLPLARHRVVSEMLDDPEVVGYGIDVRTWQVGFPVMMLHEVDTTYSLGPEHGTGTYIAETWAPILGRRALRNIAATLERMEQLYQ